jgi:hypothetical protein
MDIPRWIIALLSAQRGVREISVGRPEWTLIIDSFQLNPCTHSLGTTIFIFRLLRAILRAKPCAEGVPMGRNIDIGAHQ